MAFTPSNNHPQKQTSPDSSSATPPSRPVELFGGAITAQLPTSLTDSSEFRQIPDHQEVYVDTRNQNQSWIIEILELSDDHEKDDATRFHFNQLVTDNLALRANLLLSDVRKNPKFMPNGETVDMFTSMGLQVVQKFNITDKADFILLLLAVVRLEKLKTDIVVTLNAPLVTQVPSNQIDNTWEKISEEMSSGGSEEIREAQRIFNQSLETLQLLDLSLFNN